MSTSEDRWRAIWLRGGRISEVTWIGTDTLAWCSSLHIVFLDVSTNVLRLPRFSNDVVSAGVSCLSGHFNHRIFAFTEKNTNPKIFIYAYPSMTKICACVEERNHAYLATAFAGDYLVSLSSMPDFKLTVWLWRSGDKIASVDTDIRDAEAYGQTLRVNLLTPTFIAQVGNATGTLFTWLMTACSNTVILSKNKVILPKKALVKDVAWCPESSDVLAIADRDGHVYLSNSTGTEVKRIVLSQRCGICREIEPAAICWHQGGIVLRTTFCQIRYFRKNENNFWKKVWYTKSKSYPCALTSHPFRNDRLFFATQQGHIVNMSFDKETWEGKLDVKHFIGGEYLFVDFINPWEDLIVAIDASMDLSIVQACQAAEVTNVKLNITGRITCMLSHPDYPLVILSSDKGEVVFVSVFNYKEPKILGNYRLQTNTLDLMKFSNTGRYLIVCQKEKGVCYIFKISSEDLIKIIASCDAMLKTIDVLLFDSSNNLKLCLLHGLSNSPVVGNKLYFFNLGNDDDTFERSVDSIAFKRYYEHLHHIPGESNHFVGSPYLTKHLRYFKFNNNTNEVNCFDAVHTGHNVKQAKIFINKNWLITSGLDGTIVVKSVRTRRGDAKYYMTHHPSDLGVKKAIVNSSGDLIIGLGANGSLVALKHVEQNKISNDNDKFENVREFCQVNMEDYKNKIYEYTNSFDDRKIAWLSEEINLFLDTENISNLIWIDWKKEQDSVSERKEYADKKEEVMKSFGLLKAKIVDLLNKNDINSEFKKLPISEFDLDKASREKMMKSAKDDREEVQRKLESDCLAMDRLSEWIKTELWDPQKVLARSIFGIFDDTEVSNYTVVEEVLTSPEFLNYAKFCRNVNKELTCDVSIYPWKTYSNSNLNLYFDKQSRVKAPDANEKINVLIDKEEGKDTDSEEKNLQLFEGMTTHRYIEPSESYFSQFEIYSFSQIMCDSHNAIADCTRLREYFNKQFDDMYTLKEREMNLVRERIDRILHINSELQVMFNESLSEVHEYPVWNPKEKPEGIIQVTDAELTKNVYVSPSEQYILNKKAAEEERERLAMLADDFCERALEAMMDGVLELRWEDLIKRDPTKPECILLGKAPEEYTDEDNFAVKRYEQDVRNLQSEREKYRKMLHTDYIKINGALNEGIEKFNSRLQEFHLVKMKIEAAIQQINLRYVRYFSRHVERVYELTEDRKLKYKIEEYYESISVITKKMSTIESASQELRQQYENLMSKDKYMDKTFKNNLMSIGKNAFTIISLQYKRRPRIILKTVSSAELIDLAKTTVSMKKLPYLTFESLEYLKQLELLDIRPETLPPSIDDFHWKNLVVLRRLRIDLELRQRAALLEVDAASRILTNCSRKINELRVDIDDTRFALRRSRVLRNESDMNAELQLVLKMGQVEMNNLRGQVNKDYVDSVMVSLRELDRVNIAIATEGRKKLRIMERNLDFSRGIIGEEWEHRCLITKLKHLHDQLYYVKSANVTRGIQSYLKKLSKGEKEDISLHRMEKAYEVTREKQEKYLNDWELKRAEVIKNVIRIQVKNKKFDEKILKMNVERCDMELQRDHESEQRQKDCKNNIMKLIVGRSAVVRELLQNYEELLQLRKERDKWFNLTKVPPRSIKD